MKKLSIGILFLTVLVSCKKNHDCSCDYYTNGTKQTSNVTTFTNETKAKAKKRCKNLNSEGSFIFGGMAVDNETKCTLL